MDFSLAPRRLTHEVFFGNDPVHPGTGFLEPKNHLVWKAKTSMRGGKLIESKSFCPKKLSLVCEPAVDTRIYTVYNIHLNIHKDISSGVTNQYILMIER